MRLTTFTSTLVVLLMSVCCKAELVSLSVVRYGSILNNQFITVVDNVAHIGIGEPLVADYIDSSLRVSPMGVLESDANGKFVVLDAHTPTEQAALTDKRFTIVQGYLNYNGNPTFTAVPDTANGGFLVYAGVLQIRGAFPITILASSYPGNAAAEDDYNSQSPSSSNNAAIEDAAVAEGQASVEKAISLTSFTSALYPSGILSTLFATPTTGIPAPAAGSGESGAPAAGSPVTLTITQGVVPSSTVTAPSNLSLLNPQPSGVPTAVPPVNSSTVVASNSSAFSLTTALFSTAVPTFTGPITNTSAGSGLAPASALPTGITSAAPSLGTSAVAPESAAGTANPIIGDASHVLTSIRCLLVVLAFAGGLIVLI